MCEPVSIAMAVGSMVMQMYQGREQQRMYNQQAEYNDAIAQNDAVMNQRAQEDEARKGRREETLRRLQTKQAVGTKKGLLSASGFDINTGSALTLQSDVQAMGDLEALTIRSNSQRKIYGLQVDNVSRQANAAAQSYSMRNQGAAAFNKGVTGAISTGFGAYQQGMFRGGSSAIGGAAMSKRGGYAIAAPGGSF